MGFRWLRSVYGFGARLFFLDLLFPKLWQRIRFPSVSMMGGPNITEVAVEEDTLWNLVGLDISKGKPTLRLVTGPIDNIVGTMNVRNGDVVIDVGELTLTGEAVTGGDAELDRAITRTVAHEARHRWQLQRWGRLGMVWDKVLLALFAIILFTVCISRPYFAITGLAIKHLTGITLVGGMIASLIIWYVLFRKFLRLVMVFTYHFSRCERDARRFAKRATEDPRWQEVVRVIRHHLVVMPVGMPTGDGADHADKGVSECRI
jgi:hypothetical protein